MIKYLLQNSAVLNRAGFPPRPVPRTLARPSHFRSFELWLGDSEDANHPRPLGFLPRSPAEHRSANSLLSQRPAFLVPCPLSFSTSSQVK